jgi:hypothetical protein
MMLRSSFPPVVSKRAYLPNLCLCVYSCVQGICVRVVFSFVHHMLPVSLDGTFFLAPSLLLCLLHLHLYLKSMYHGNDLSEINITRFSCTIYTIGKCLRLLLISSLHTYSVLIHERCYVWSMDYRPVICIISSTLYCSLSEFVMNINVWSFFHFKFCLVSHFPF